MVVIVAYTTHISRKAISSALLTSGDEQTVEMAADPDVAELLRCGGQRCGCRVFLVASLSGWRCGGRGHAAGPACLPAWSAEHASSGSVGKPTVRAAACPRRPAAG